MIACEIATNSGWSPNIVYEHDKQGTPSTILQVVMPIGTCPPTPSAAVTAEVS